MQSSLQLSTPVVSLSAIASASGGREALARIRMLGFEGVKSYLEE